MVMAFIYLLLKTSNVNQLKGDNMVKVGNIIRIVSMESKPPYSCELGVIEFIDDVGQIHGSWGGCALILGVDEYQIIEE